MTFLNISNNPMTLSAQFDAAATDVYISPGMLVAGIDAGLASSDGDSSSDDAAELQPLSVETPSECIRVASQKAGDAIKVCTASDCIACGAGSFALADGSGCSPCSAGGFYQTAESAVQTIPTHSHCGCGRCIDGTFTNRTASTDITDCAVCPSGTKTDANAGYRACQCLDGFSRVDRFGPCQSCEGQKGVECIADSKTLLKGYWWGFASPNKLAEYTNFAKDLPLEDGYTIRRYDGTSPASQLCPRQESCLGGVASTCEEGYTGVLCAVCGAEHFD